MHVSRPTTIAFSIASWVLVAGGVCAAEAEWQAIRPGGDTRAGSSVRKKKPKKKGNSGWGRMWILLSPLDTNEHYGV